MTDHAGGASPASRLHELLLESEDISGFLDELVTVTARELSAEAGQVWCAVLLLRPKRPATVASSDPGAAALDEVQYHAGEGPCLTAAREDRLVYLRDIRADPRWPEYRKAAAEAGVLSVLGVPLDLGDEAAAALDVYSDRADAFDEAALEAVRRHAMALSTALRLAVRLARHRDTEADLRAAMASRTDIDLAVGIIMGQNHCPQEQAVEMLRAASNRRNVKLRELAADLVHRVGHGPASTHFDA